jgi:hypothetical protein
MEMVWLLLRKPGNDIQLAEIHKENHLRRYTEIYGRLVPSRLRMQNVKNGGSE